MPTKLHEIRFDPYDGMLKSGELDSIIHRFPKNMQGSFHRLFSLPNDKKKENTLSREETEQEIRKLWFEKSRSYTLATDF